MRAQQWVCESVSVCLSERLIHVLMLLKMSVRSCRHNILHSSFFQFKIRTIFVLVIQMLLLPPDWHTSAAAVLWPSCSVCSGCGLWTGPSLRKSCLMEPDTAMPLPPCPQWPHCLLHINKLADPPGSRRHSATAAAERLTLIHTSRMTWSAN